MWDIIFSLLITLIGTYAVVFTGYYVNRTNKERIILILIFICSILSLWLLKIYRMGLFGW